MVVSSLNPCIYTPSNRNKTGSLDGFILISSKKMFRSDTVTSENDRICTRSSYRRRPYSRAASDAEFHNPAIMKTATTCCLRSTIEGGGVSPWWDASTTEDPDVWDSVSGSSSNNADQRRPMDDTLVKAAHVLPVASSPRAVADDPGDPHDPHDHHDHHLSTRSLGTRFTRKRGGHP